MPSSARRTASVPRSVVSLEHARSRAAGTHTESVRLLALLEVGVLAWAVLAMTGIAASTPMVQSTMVPDQPATLPMVALRPEMPRSLSIPVVLVDRASPHVAEGLQPPTER